ncbi:hypothetical protein HCCG_00570 [Helicobacter cinaedi CCUG 18818 = ATCC BAA-847]|uniref:Uncharacterized protein n=1 Tax=Helicobacter cinaedi CCUG 18818 = ATCC BAA-847 TaxID=537971 RepID=A0ABN0BB84_9HELI|nr:hypothetical protein HCCG_00570 [Helicobacter cinaedi CCUG 18818 = ATCC BAA-847]BBB20950.1 hypothetical protein HC081234_21270 [Helicobacter cinaedi]
MNTPFFFNLAFLIYTLIDRNLFVAYIGGWGGIKSNTLLQKLPAKV